MNWIYTLSIYTDEKDWVRAWTVESNRLDAMFRVITDRRKKIGRALAVYIIQRLRLAFNLGGGSRYYAAINTLRYLTDNYLSSDIYDELEQLSDIELLTRIEEFIRQRIPLTTPATRDLRNVLSATLSDVTDREKEAEERRFTGFFKPYIGDDANESFDSIEEAYSDEEIDDFIGKTFNLQKIENVYRRNKYGSNQLYASTRCIKCGRKKRVFLSNLVNDPDKYGSCICSDENIDSRIENAEKLYTNKKRLSTNTSGYTGVSFVKNYGGAPYNKWRAYIEVDGTRTYLGDFDTKKEAITARKKAGEKGIQWYKENRSKLVKNVRRRTKKYQTSKYRDTLEKTKTKINKE